MVLFAVIDRVNSVYAQICSDQWDALSLRRSNWQKPLRMFAASHVLLYLHSIILHELYSHADFVPIPCDNSSKALLKHQGITPGTSQ